jgi:hypothetical protein
LSKRQQEFNQILPLLRRQLLAAELFRGVRLFQQVFECLRAAIVQEWAAVPVAAQQPIFVVLLCMNSGRLLLPRSGFLRRGTPGV